ncbi:mono/diheme cytochrome c family protein [Chitinivorax tropicus]|uniref:Mono/diheme cytochrome c family protein n=1 Tax=Chitinivorax tropicus TaxID=714531 RepID=A0A840MLU5_9PROT|nr:cytochrome c [Chitinivorax tropicus]MBB5018099.1 mono/diheme cytochrome c family protein [Chitinivorax tropicus]
MHTLLKQALAAALFTCSSLSFATPVLSIANEQYQQAYEKQALLAETGLREIDVPNDVSYHKAMRYQAVPLQPLLKKAGIQASDSLKFTASDGFAVTLSASLLLAEGKAEPYLAIETDDAPWPPVKPGKPGTAGPLYVVWLSPEKSGITPEMWPYQLARIERVQPVEIRYPQLQPAATLPANSPIRNGFAQFKQHCLPCHSLNKAGDANLAPDLNIPHNPTEYLRAPYLRTLVRNPQKLRHWERSAMPAVDEKTLSERDLTDLLAYLRHMSTRKVK